MRPIRRRSRARAPGTGPGLALLLLVQVACGGGTTEPGPTPASAASAPSADPPLRFTDVTSAAGIGFSRVNGATGEKLLPETMGGGVAFLDSDGDGDQDLLFVNGAAWPHDEPVVPAPTPALYRNDGAGRFEDVTAGAGLAVTMQGMGVAAGDHDGDGDTDLFFANVGRDRLFRNDGGRFTDVTDASGVGGDPAAWSSSAGFLDFDRDGDLDLWVVHYVEWSVEIDRAIAFSLNGKDRAYGPPHRYRGTDSTLWRNDGGGRFTDVSAEAGILVADAGEPVGKGLALTFHDFDEDGFLDVHVVNDTTRNFLFRNRGDGTFEELGVPSGTAYDASGAATGSMGVDVADAANDGTAAIAVANFAHEATSYFVQQGEPWLFADRAASAGIASASLASLSFGLLFFDADLDGRIDLLQSNGHLDEAISQVQPDQRYEQPAQLFLNRGSSNPRFEDVAARAGDLARPIVGRGSSFADMDGDGDLDVVVAQPRGAPLLLRNDRDLGRHGLRVRLVGRTGQREAIGARVALTAGGVTQRRTVMPTRSYLSQVELPLTFGLGESTTVDALRVTWPDGSVTDAAVAGVDRMIVVTQPE